jgi:hypothetical protein
MSTLPSKIRFVARRVGPRLIDHPQASGQKKAENGQHLRKRKPSHKRSDHEPFSQSPLLREDMLIVENSQATPFFLNQSSNFFQPSSARSLR